MQLFKTELMVINFFKRKKRQQASHSLLNGIVTYITLRLKSDNMKHLTESQRYTIESMLRQGYCKTSIADVVGVHKCTISREINRNKDLRSDTYRSQLAQDKSNKRKLSKPKSVKFDSEMQQMVEAYLYKDYSPEQIVGFCKNKQISCVSHERIYQHIWQDKKHRGRLYEHLRRQGRKYRKRGSSKDSRGIIPNKINIKQRPAIVDKKTRFGDLEIDTIIGKNHKQAIVTINDRAAGVLWMKRIEQRTADLVYKATIELLEPYAPMIKTITSDNGKEFAMFQKIADELKIDYYFANPYHSWERGANENLNGLIRQYIPKKTDFASLTDEFISNIETKLNQRPRKRFGFINPNQKMGQLINQVAFAA